MKSFFKNLALIAAAAVMFSAAAYTQQQLMGTVIIGDATSPLTKQAQVTSQGHLITDTNAAVYRLTALGCQKFGAVVSSGFTSVPVGATVAFMSIEGANVRMRDDGTNPTSSTGVLFLIGGPWPYQGPLAAAQFIQTAATATINVCFYD
jgi:hypothetical protein